MSDRRLCRSLMWFVSSPTSTGMIPDRPALAAKSRTNQEVAADLSNMVEVVTEPEAEISLVEGQTKVIQSRRELTRIVVSNPLIADVELLNDQPNSTAGQSLWKVVRHDEPHHVGPDQPAGFFPGASHPRHQGPELADQPGLSWRGCEGPPGRARRSSWMARCPTRKPCLT